MDKVIKLVIEFNISVQTDDASIVEVRAVDDPPKQKRKPAKKAVKEEPAPAAVVEPEPVTKEEQAAGPESESKPEHTDGKPKKTGRPKTVDSGKIKALYEAGWEVKDIAADVGCAISSVTRVLTGLRREGILGTRRAKKKIDQSDLLLSNGGHELI